MKEEFICETGFLSLRGNIRADKKVCFKMKKARKKRRQMTVNLVVKVKGCDKDFGLGPGVLLKQKRVCRDNRGWGFAHPMFQVALNDAKEAAIREVIQVEALVLRPPKELKS